MLSLLTGHFLGSGSLELFCGHPAGRDRQQWQQVTGPKHVTPRFGQADVDIVACVRTDTEIALLTLFLSLYPRILCAPRAQATLATAPRKAVFKK